MELTPGRPAEPEGRARELGFTFSSLVILCWRTAADEIAARVCELTARLYEENQSWQR